MRGNLLNAGFASKFLHELLGDVPQLAHRLDHVDGNANGAGLVGDGARDGLTNPPCRGCAELIAALVFVLVDRAHETGIAFLNKVEKGQAAVPVLFGDADDKAQIAGRQLALGVLILLKAALHGFDAPQQFVAVLENLFLQLHDFLSGLADALGALGRLAGTFHLVAQCIDAVGNLAQPIHDVLHFARANADLFDKGHGAASALPHSAVDPDLLLDGQPCTVQFAVVLTIAFHHPRKGLNILDQPFGNVFPVVFHGGIEVEGPVKGLATLAHAFEDDEAVINGIVGFEKFRPESLASDFDFLGQSDFLFSRQERDFTHLGEIHAHRVVNAGDRGHEIGTHFRLGRFGRAGATRLGFGFVDKLDAHLVKLHENFVNLLRRDRFVGKAVVQLLIRKVAVFLSPLDNRIHRCCWLLRLRRAF